MHGRVAPQCCVLKQSAGCFRAGFTNRSESEYDPFGAGHSSTSISAALGMAVARDFKVCSAAYTLLAALPALRAECPQRSMLARLQLLHAVSCHPSRWLQSLC